RSAAARKRQELPPRDRWIEQGPASPQYNVVMRCTRRQALATLAAASTGTLVDPGPVLARLAADVPCSSPAGTRIDSLPLFRVRSQAQPFGVKISGEGLDARLITDLSI